ncbi:hypothetical protein MMC22_004267 [Lobaria immixta]|nr:hypothetical protein [Lobaria immixta]
MLSSTTPNPINPPNSNHQSPTIPTQKSSNRKPLKEVVLHHPLMPTPLEDWILFPDQIIHTKHSIVRDSRARQAKERLQPEEPSRPSSAYTTVTSRATSTSSRNTSISSFIEEPRDQSNSPCTSDRPGDVAKSTSYVAEESPRNPPRMKTPQRLPTPDLSDVEQDSFWSCCGSSEESLRDEMDCAIRGPTIFAASLRCHPDTRVSARGQSPKLQVSSLRPQLKMSKRGRGGASGNKLRMTLGFPV